MNNVSEYYSCCFLLGIISHSDFYKLPCQIACTVFTIFWEWFSWQHLGKRASTCHTGRVGRLRQHDTLWRQKAVAGLCRYQEWREISLTEKWLGECQESNNDATHWSLLVFKVYFSPLFDTPSASRTILTSRTSQYSNTAVTASPH